MEIIATGSRGNCYEFYNKDHYFFIDCGVTKSKLKHNPKFILYTHRHGDHYNAKLEPVENYAPEALNGRTSILKPKKGYLLHGVKIVALEAHHDAPTLSYYVDTGAERALIITDTAAIPAQAEKVAKAAEIICIEANYTADLLDACDYPEFLKERIRLNHLETSQAVAFAAKFPNKKIIFTHLSDNSQDPAIVAEAARFAGLQNFHVLQNGQGLTV